MTFRHTMLDLMPLSLFIAVKYLRAKRKEGFISLISLLSVAGVMVGVMALVIVIAVMSGAETEFRNRILGVEPHILVMEYAGRFTEYEKVITTIASISTDPKQLNRQRDLSSSEEEAPPIGSNSTTPDDLHGNLKRYPITAVSPIVYGQGMIRTSTGFSGAVIRGIDPQSPNSMVKGYTPDDLKRLLSSQIQYHENKSPTESLHGMKSKKEKREKELPGTTVIHYPGILLGKSLAVNLGVTTGDKVIMLSTGGMLSPVGHMPSMKRFQVVGLFESGMYEYDSSLVYMHLEDAQKLMGMEGRISAIGVWVDEIFTADDIKEGIVASLQYPYYGRDWMEINQSLFSALKLEKTAMFVILTLIVLVAAFNIASALIMMVMEKTRDIAVFKAMGATDGMIRNAFMLQGMIIGIFGTVVGTLLGVGICSLLEKYHFIELPAAYPFSTLPVQLEMGDVVLIAAASVAICFLSTLYPSYKASRMRPVEALRYG